MLPIVGDTWQLNNDTNGGLLWKTRTKMQTDTLTPEMAAFSKALKKVLGVSKERLDYLREVDKVTPLVPQKRGRKPKETMELIIKLAP